MSSSKVSQQCRYSWFDFIKLSKISKISDFIFVFSIFKWSYDRKPRGFQSNLLFTFKYYYDILCKYNLGKVFKYFGLVY